MIQLPAVQSQPTTWSLPPERANAVVAALSSRADELVSDLVQAIAAAPRVVNEPVWVPPPVVGQATCVANVRSVLAAMVTPSAFDAESAMTNGADRARQGSGISAFMT